MPTDIQAAPSTANLSVAAVTFSRAFHCHLGVASQPPDGLISWAVAQTAASAVRRSARSCSLPSTSSVSFLRPASASRPTSHPPRASATNTTPAVCQPGAATVQPQRHAAFTWTTATSTAGMTRTPQSSSEQLSRSVDFCDRCLPLAGLRRVVLNGGSGDCSGHLFGFGAPARCGDPVRLLKARPPVPLPPCGQWRPPAQPASAWCPHMRRARAGARPGSGPGACRCWDQLVRPAPSTGRRPGR